MQAIKTEINEGQWTLFDETEDIFDLSSILKLFFKELTKPLIPWNLIPELYVASNAASKEIRIQSIIQCLSTLPISHQATLKFLLKHLLKIEAFKDDNKMTFANIGVCFAPSLTMPPDSGVEPDDVNRVTKLAFVMQKLLRQYDDIYSKEYGDLIRISLIDGDDPRYWDEVFEVLDGNKDSVDDENTPDAGTGDHAHSGNDHENSDNVQIRPKKNSSKRPKGVFELNGDKAPTGDNGNDTIANNDKNGDHASGDNLKNLPDKEIQQEINPHDKRADDRKDVSAFTNDAGINIPENPGKPIQHETKPSDECITFEPEFGFVDKDGDDFSNIASITDEVAKDVEDLKSSNDSNYLSVANDENTRHSGTVDYVIGNYHAGDENQDKIQQEKNPHDDLIEEPKGAFECKDDDHDTTITSITKPNKVIQASKEQIPEDAIYGTYVEGFKN